VRTKRNLEDLEDLNVGCKGGLMTKRLGTSDSFTIRPHLEIASEDTRN
jgi:hypothetical protein